MTGPTVKEVRQVWECGLDASRFGIDVETGVTMWLQGGMRGPASEVLEPAEVPGVVEMSELEL